jgi:hypothetical protein
MAHQAAARKRVFGSILAVASEAAGVRTCRVAVAREGRLLRLLE